MLSQAGKFKKPISTGMVRCDNIKEAKK